MQGDALGKVVTIYLSDEEVISLKDFCDENQCSQYSALKTAVKELLHKPVEPILDDVRLDKSQEEAIDIIKESEIKEEHFEENKETAVMSALRKILSQRN
jgi:hypothetical protein